MIFIFAERLKQLRLDSDMKQSDLGKILEVSASTIGMYEQGRRYPDFDTLIKISNYFDVSTDYLLGKTSKIKEQNTPDNLTKKQLKALDLANELSDEEFNNIINLIKSMKKGT